MNKKEIRNEIIQVVVMAAIFKYLIKSTKIKGISMEPSVYENDRMIFVRNNRLNNIGYNSRVIITVDSKAWIKRVVALPGDTLMIKSNSLYVNNVIYNDCYANLSTMMDDHPLIQLADDEYFVLGDNRNHSKDSRVIGPVKLEDIKAAHGIRIWPLRREAHYGKSKLRNKKTK